MLCGRVGLRGGRGGVGGWWLLGCRRGPKVKGRYGLVIVCREERGEGRVAGSLLSRGLGRWCRRIWRG